MDEGAVLHGLAGDVEREVGAVHDAAQEAEPFGEEALGLGSNEDFAAMQGDARRSAAKAEAFGIGGGHEEEGVQRERGIGGEVQPGERVLGGVGLELVEFPVLFRGDFLFVLEPEGLDFVDALAVCLLYTSHVG